MIAEVAILRRLPRHHHFFDYIVPHESPRVGIGSLIEAPFRGQLQPGIVINLKKASATPRLKSINRVINEHFIGLGQLSLAVKISEHYGVALGQSLGLFTPVRPNRRFKPLFTEFKKIPGHKQNNNWLFIYHQATSRLPQLKKLATQVTGRGEQILILAPDLNNLLLLKKYLGQGYEWHSNLTTLEQQKTWLAVHDGSASIIIATRSGLFLPFANLGGILVDNSDSENYKQSDQNPRYDAIEVVSWLKDIWQCSLALFSAAPRLEDLSSAKRLPWKNVSLGKPQPNRIIIIDLKNKPLDDKIITPELLSGITGALAVNRKVFLYYNRRGSNTAVLCRDCGYMVRCPDCRKVLVWHEQHKILLCHTCGTKHTLPIPCPQCHGSNLHYLGTGVSELEKKLQKIFTDKRIIKVDSDDKINLSSPTVSQCHIALGTSRALPLLEMHNFGLVAVLSLESELIMPDFRSVEFAWMRLRRLLASSSGRLYIQTYHPDLEWLNFLSTEPAIFFNFMLKERNQFNWPPQVELLRLTIKQSTEYNALKMAQKLSDTLKKQVINKSVSIVGPYPDYHIKEGGRFVYHLLLKYPKTFKVESLWEVLPADVIIDRHPRFVLS